MQTHLSVIIEGLLAVERVVFGDGLHVPLRVVGKVVAVPGTALRARVGRGLVAAPARQRASGPRHVVGRELGGNRRRRARGGRRLALAHGMLGHVAGRGVLLGLLALLGLAFASNKGGQVGGAGGAGGAEDGAALGLLGSVFGLDFS